MELSTFSKVLYSYNTCVELVDADLLCFAAFVSAFVSAFASVVEYQLSFLVLSCFRWWSEHSLFLHVLPGTSVFIKALQRGTRMPWTWQTSGVSFWDPVCCASPQLPRTGRSQTLLHFLSPHNKWISKHFIEESPLYTFFLLVFWHNYFLFLLDMNNNRYQCLRFTVDCNSVLHGFAGYFETTLYSDVTLSK